MKAKIAYIVLVILILSIKVNYAGNDSLSFKQSIVNKITYPEFAMKDKLEAEVWVQFSIENNGQVVVNLINSVDVLFLEYVKSELQKLVIDSESELKGKTYFYKFTFKYQ